MGADGINGGVGVAEGIRGGVFAEGLKDGGAWANRDGDSDTVSGG